jgi:diadenosine tetraphosphate (Ap4A) HIT family hydrolase
MSILTVFNLTTMNADKYNRVIRDLDGAGQGKPKARLHHIASRQEDGSFVVTDIWASAELLAELSRTLMPTLKNAAVTPVETEVQPVHNVIAG